MDRDVMIVAVALAALWLWEQNQIYQRQLQPISQASGAVGQLASTVNTYVPTLVGAIDYWAHSS